MNTSGTHAYKNHCPPLAVGKSTSCLSCRDCPGAENVQTDVSERRVDEESIGREVGHLLGLDRAPQLPASNAMADGCAHAPLAADNSISGCANGPLGKETPLVFNLRMVVSHKQQPHMVFPRNDDGVFFV